MPLLIALLVLAIYYPYGIYNTQSKSSNVIIFAPSHIGANPVCGIIMAIAEESNVILIVLVLLHQQNENYVEFINKSNSSVSQ
jgi:fumarate reductase subunit D